MQSLPLKHPEVYANLKNGEFSCQIGKTRLVGYQMIKQSKKLSIKIYKQQAAQKDLAPKQVLLQSIISLQMTVPAMSNSSDQWYQRKTNKFTHPDMLKETWKNLFEFTSETLAAFQQESYHLMKLFLTCAMLKKRRISIPAVY